MQVADLSPAAQAVLDAFTGDDTIYGLHLMVPKLATALRTAADQVVPVRPAPGAASLKEFERWYVKRFVRMQLLAIADELEAQ